MSLYDWLLFLHMLAAFAMVGSAVVFTILTVVLWNVDRPATAVALFGVARPAGVLVAIGGMGTLIFGIWLAIYLDAYHPWDGWILGALALWAVAGGAGGRTGKHYTAAQKLAERLLAQERRDGSGELAAALRAPLALVLQGVTVLALVGLLALMVYKPGA